MMDKDIGQGIYEILKETIPDAAGVEMIYTNHYLFDGPVKEYDGYDEKHHLLMIRDGMYCYQGCERDFDLDTLEITKALEKQLPVKVDCDDIITIQNGKTYKFYIEILGEE